MSSRRLVAAATTMAAFSHFVVQGGTVQAAVIAMPDWDIPALCKSESVPGQCRLHEREARRTVSGGWKVLPEGYKSACLDQVKEPDDKSYRLLNQCIEEQVRGGLAKKDLIDVAATADAAGPTPAGGTSSGEASGGGGESAAGGGYPILPTEGLEQLLRERATWGAGPDPTSVEAPLAAGAVVPLPKSDGRSATGEAAEPPILHEAETTPPPQLTPVPQSTLESELDALLKDREGWRDGAVKGDGGDRIAEAGRNGTEGYDSLTTRSLAALLSQRATWGTGAPAKQVAAQLAAGARVPLASTSTSALVGGSNADVIINPYVPTPVPTLTAVPQEKLATELDALLKERASWGEASATLPGSRAAGEAGASDGYAVLSTATLAALLDQRSD